MQNKKQAFELITGICDINEKVWNNYAGSYDDAKEAAYQVEEALEGLQDLPYLATRLHPDNESHEENFNPKECSRQIVKLAMMDAKGPMEDVERFDKALDAIYFAIGSMHKLGLSPHAIVEGLQVVHTANLQKTGVKDSEGKVGKPANFQPPEEKLQAILDKRERINYVGLKRINGVSYPAVEDHYLDRAALAAGDTYYSVTRKCLTKR